MESSMSFRDVLEILYFASGIAIAILAFLGLRSIRLASEQISVTREIFKMQSKSSAAEAAVNECIRFSDRVIQSSIKIDQAFEADQIAFLEKAKFKREGSKVMVDLSDVDKDELKKIQPHSLLINEFLNGMEAHALFFLSGVADEDLAYKANGRSFTDLGETAFKFFAITGVGSKDVIATKELYFRWSRKLEHEELRDEKIKIEKKLNTFEELPANRPIGT